MLGVFGFTKYVKGEAIQITKFVYSEKQKKKVCALCNQLFLNKKGLSVHTHVKMAAQWISTGCGP